MKDENMICAQHIAYLRNKINLKQDELAAVVSEMTQREKPYTTTIVSAWETGRRTPSREAASAMADLFNTSVEYILGKTNAIDKESEKEEVSILASSKLSFDELGNYHKLPVYVVFPKMEYPDCWAIADCTDKKEVYLLTTYGKISVTRNNMPYDIYPKETDFINANSKEKRNRLGMIQVIDSKKPVYIEMTSNNAEIRAAYNGWYRITQDKAFLQGDTGKILPISGFGSAYNCYHNN